MPRFVEDIVQAHQISRDRVRRGLPSWTGKLSFMGAIGALVKKHQAGDLSLKSQDLLDAFHAAAKEIRAKVPQAQGKYFKGDDDDLEFFVLTMEEFTLESLEASPDILEEFDEALDRLYSWADVHRWWIEPSNA